MAQGYAEHYGKDSVLRRPWLGEAEERRESEEGEKIAKESFSCMTLKQRWDLLPCAMRSPLPLSENPCD